MKRAIPLLAAFFLFVHAQTVCAQDVAPSGNIWTKTALPAGSVQWTSPGFVTKNVDPRMVSQALRIAGPAVEVSGSYNMGFQAGKALINTKGVVTGLKVASVVGGVLGGPIGVGLTGLLLVPGVLDWLLQAGVTPNATPTPGHPFSMVKQQWSGPYGGIFDSADAACRSGGWSPMTVIYYWDEPNSARCSDGAGSNFARIEKIGSPSLAPASYSDFQPYLSGLPVSIDLINNLVKAGYTFPLDNKTVSGPSSVSATPVVKTTNSVNAQGESITTTNTTNQKTDLTYQGDKVIGNTTTTTTTNVFNNTTNSVVSNTTSSENKPDAPSQPEKEKEEFCQQNPDALACAETDTPEGEIPKTNKNITFTAQNPFGGGSCPADKFQTLHTGQSLKVVDWATPCGYIATYVRPVLILLGAWAAMMLLIPGRTES